MKINTEKKNVNEWIDVAKKGGLGKNHPKLWKKVYDSVAVPKRSRSDVNLFKINKCSNDNDYIVVPGKVLSEGTIDHKINITAIEYSSKALDALKSADCKIIDINKFYDLVNEGKHTIKIIKK